jgi:exodeoxyribonuclease V alpha subunit
MKAETYKGRIEKILYHSTDTGYSVLLLEPVEDGEFERLTVTGSLLDPSPDDEIQITGTWTDHPKYGKQFKIESYTPLMPSTETGIIAYLGSGVLPGIGPKTAEKIVQEFENIFDVLDDAPEKLLSISGINAQKLEKIIEAWKTQKGVHLVMSHLMGYGITTAYAIRIYKKYGGDAVQTVSNNPYKLCEDIPGIGFLMADKIAKETGIEITHPMRLNAGVLHVLSQIGVKGHVYYPRKRLVQKATDILHVDPDLINTAIESLSHKNKIMILDTEDQAVYTQKMLLQEAGIAECLTGLQDNSQFLSMDGFTSNLATIEKEQGFTLAEQQIEAVKTCCSHPVCIVSGGPGTGKTTIISTICKLLVRNLKSALKIVMAAPTGRAAKRMSESTGYASKTIHRLLEFKEGKFNRTFENPLEGDVFIIDESSMIDTWLMFKLLVAIPPYSRVIFVGDIHQLPSVGPGTVLKSMIDSQKIYSPSHRDF